MSVKSILKLGALRGIPVSITSRRPKSTVISSGLIISSYTLKEELLPILGERGWYNFIKPVSLLN